MSYRLRQAAIVVLVLVIAGLFTFAFYTAVSGSGGRHQEFRDYCASKGGVIFENNRNFDCVLNGVKISYYGD